MAVVMQRAPDEALVLSFKVKDRYVDTMKIFGVAYYVRLGDLASKSFQS